FHILTTSNFLVAVSSPSRLEGQLKSSSVERSKLLSSLSSFVMLHSISESRLVYSSKGWDIYDQSKSRTAVSFLVNSLKRKLPIAVASFVNSPDLIYLEVLTHIVMYHSFPLPINFTQRSFNSTS